MRLVWTVKLYHATKFKVKLEGAPRDYPSPHVFADGKGNTPVEALKEAIDKMSKSDQASFRLLLNPA